VTLDEIDELAARLAERMSGHFIPATLPKFFGDYLRAPGMGLSWRHQIPHGPHGGFGVHYVITPDGEIRMEIVDMNGARVWEGTLISER
jgi:hypothetical protein